MGGKDCPSGAAPAMLAAKFAAIASVIVTIIVDLGEGCMV
jgi:hypothetical protein